MCVQCQISLSLSLFYDGYCFKAMNFFLISLSSAMVCFKFVTNRCLSFSRLLSSASTTFFLSSRFEASVFLDCARLSLSSLCVFRASSSFSRNSSVSLFTFSMAAFASCFAARTLCIASVCFAATRSASNRDLAPASVCASAYCSISSFLRFCFLANFCSFSSSSFFFFLLLLFFFFFDCVHTTNTTVKVKGIVRSARRRRTKEGGGGKEGEEEEDLMKLLEREELENRNAAPIAGFVKSHVVGGDRDDVPKNPEEIDLGFDDEEEEGDDDEPKTSVPSGVYGSLLSSGGKKREREDDEEEE
mmetsp:Transcript_2494/g.8017  ORF Transcript_2494/g.8017 Transcript_2494/m.8017 type:complete len:302 (+) Transcript_2494:158-1063(+)